MKYDSRLGREWRPYRLVQYQGKIKELISMPYPGDMDEAWIAIRDKDDSTTLEHVPLADLQLI